MAPRYTTRHQKVFEDKEIVESAKSQLELDDKPGKPVAREHQMWRLATVAKDAETKDDTAVDAIAYLMCVVKGEVRVGNREKTVELAEATLKELELHKDSKTRYEEATRRVK